MAAASKIKYLVEIVGTFILVYAVCSAATVYSESNNLVGIVCLDRLSMIGIRLGCCFCYNCNNVCYIVSLWSSD